MTATTVSKEALTALTKSALEGGKTSPENAGIVAEALVAAEIDGQYGHGLSRLETYVPQTIAGKVDGFAVPALQETALGAIRVDACFGFGFPAIKTAIDDLTVRTKTQGVAAAGIYRSHHFGVAGHHVEKLAEAGLVSMTFSNSPKAIAPWGGKRPFFGTNPIAFAAPRGQGLPLVVDTGLSKTARGKIRVAALAGEPIPEGWALDPDGNPTTDASLAMDGALLPAGDGKGYALALMVEVLTTALVGAHFSVEASSLFNDQGPPPELGQFLLAIDPSRLSGGDFGERMEALVALLEAEEGVRLPGSKRAALRDQAEREGVTLPTKRFEMVERFASASTEEASA